MDIPILQNKKIFYDNRGYFAPVDLTQLEKSWLQSNISFNTKKFTLRGLHFQTGEYAQAKLIKVLQGKIIDFIYDMRPESTTHKELFIYDVEPGQELFVPRGFAHGFITTEDNTIIQYLVDNVYKPEAEGSIVWTKFLPLMQKFNTIPDFNVHGITINDKDLVTKNFND